MIQSLSFSHFLQDLICFVVLGNICLHIMVVITARKVIAEGFLKFFRRTKLMILTRTLLLRGWICFVVQAGTISKLIVRECGRISV